MADSTGADGRYELTLEAGVYTVTAGASGFEFAIADGVELAAGESVGRDFRLIVAAGDRNRRGDWQSCRAAAR